MKKIILILIVCIFLSNNAYAKTVKLICSYKEAFVFTDDNRYIKLTPDHDLYQYYSADDVITFNEDAKTFVGMKADSFNDDFIKVTMFDEIEGPKATIKLKKIWRVNRFTGVFTKKIYSKLVGRDTSWGSGDKIRYDCRKAKKKF